MNKREIAEIEYGEFNIRPIRVERRRIWTGKRYVWRLCQIYDAGRLQTVEPSTSPLVQRSGRGNGGGRIRDRPS